MRKRMKNVYQCQIAGCSEYGLTKTVTLDANEYNLFVLQTVQCLCGWEPKLLDSRIINVKYEHPLEYQSA